MSYEPLRGKRQGLTMSNNSDKLIERDTREIKRIVPFRLFIEVQGVPEFDHSGYRLTANGYAEVDNPRSAIAVVPGLEFFSARWFSSVQFRLGVNANSIVSLLNKANKD